MGDSPVTMVAGGLISPPIAIWGICSQDSQFHDKRMLEILYGVVNYSQVVHGSFTEVNYYISI